MSSTNLNPLSDLINHTLENYKGFDVSVLDVRDIATFTDNMIIATATSNRHARSLAEHCIEEAKKAHFSVLSIQGETEGEWILVDFGNVILHVMQPQTRDFYQLEKFWAVQEYDVAESH